MTYLPEHTIPLREITNALALSPDGALLALATRDKHAHNLLYGVGDWSPKPAPRFARYDLRFGADGALVVRGGRRGALHPEPHETGEERVLHSRAPEGNHPPGGLPRRALDRRAQVPRPPGAVVRRGVSANSAARVWTGAAQALFFAADSARFFHSSHNYEAGRPVDALHEIALHADGRTQGPTDGPLPEGLSAHHAVCATPHGLVTLGFPERDVVVYDWDVMRPRRLGACSLEGAAAVVGFAVSSSNT